MWRVTTLLMALLIAACGSTDTTAVTEASASARVTVALPAPDVDGSRNLEEVMAGRRSVRDYAEQALETRELSQLLWAAQGETSDSGKRTAPSAGALYPLEVYVVDETGVQRYLPTGHVLERIVEGDLRAELAGAALDQSAVADAAAVFVITMVEARTAAKYGDRAERYVILEAGHAAQNLLLQASALGLGAVPIGAFDDSEVQRVLSAPSDHEPLYLIPVGRPIGEGG